jgi:hypothetical protein
VCGAGVPPAPFYPAGFIRPPENGHGICGS